MTRKWIVILCGGGLALTGMWAACGCQAARGGAAARGAQSPEPAGSRVAPGASEITAGEMQAHVDFLAADALGGRDAGRQGAEVAAKYIATQFARFGLERVGDRWETEFALPGGAGPGSAELQLGDRRFTGASVIQVPDCSAATAVTARVASAEAEQFDGELVLAADVPDRQEARRRAEELLEKGAGGVVFVSDQPWLDRAARGGRFFQMGDEGAPLVTMQLGDGEVTSLEDLPPEAREQFEKMLTGMGVEVSQGQVSISIQRRPAEGEKAGGEEEHGDAGLPEGIPDMADDGVVVLGGGGGFFGSATRLNGPVVRACRPLGEMLREAASNGDQLTVRVTRPGRDTSANVLGLVKGADPALRDEYVVIGAHYDHIGTDARGNVWNGADDNASGTAAVLQIAEALAARPDRPRRSILLAAWGAEEHGIVGSGAFVREPPVPLDRIVAYVNLDMVARNDPDSVEIYSASETLSGWAEQAAGANGLTGQATSGFLLNASDSAVFVQRQIPTVFFCSGMHADLHQHSDDPEAIDADKAARVARAACAVVWRTANETERPVFTTPQRSLGGFPGMQFGGPDTGRRLGIYPAPGKGEGVGVQSVIPDSVAAAAGLRAGDRIIRIGEQRIEKVSQIRPALEPLPAGTPFEIEIRRKGSAGEETVILRGVFQTNAQRN